MMTASRSIVLEDHPTHRQSALLVYRRVRAMLKAWEAVQKRRQSAGVGIVICDVQRWGTGGLTFLQLVANKIQIKVELLIIEVLKKLRRQILHPAGIHTIKALVKTERPGVLAILQGQTISNKSAEMTSATLFTNRTSTDAIQKEFSHQEFELLLQPNINPSCGSKCNSGTLKCCTHAEHKMRPPAYSADFIEAHYPQFELTRFMSNLALHRRPNLRDDAAVAMLRELGVNAGPA